MATKQINSTPRPPGLNSNVEGSQVQNSGSAPRDRWDDVLVSRQRQRYLASLVTAEAHPSDSRCLEP